MEQPHPRSLQPHRTLHLLRVREAMHAPNRCAAWRAGALSKLQMGEMQTALNLNRKLGQPEYLFERVICFA
eukprot:scaffold159125_cov49-Prasinocladus_malaysianus.AAC.2